MPWLSFIYQLLTHNFHSAQLLWPKTCQSLFIAIIVSWQICQRISYSFVSYGISGGQARGIRVLHCCLHTRQVVPYSYSRNTKNTLELLPRWLQTASLLIPCDDCVIVYIIVFGIVSSSCTYKHKISRRYSIWRISGFHRFIGIWIYLRALTYIRMCKI